MNKNSRIVETDRLWKWRLKIAVSRRENSNPTLNLTFISDHTLIFPKKSKWRSKKHSQVSGQFEKTLKQYKDRKMTEKLMYFPVIHRAFSHSRLPYILRDTVSVFLNHRQWHSDKFFYGWEEKKTTNRRKVSIRVFSGHFCVLVLCYATLSTTH